MNFITLPHAFGSISLSLIFRFLSSCLSHLSCHPSFSLLFYIFLYPPRPHHILPRFLTLPPDLLALSFRLSSPPHLFIYLSFGSPPSSSYFSVRCVSPSRHQRRENGWGAFRLFLLPSVYLLSSMFQVSLKLTSNTSPKSFMGLPKGLQSCRLLIFDWNSRKDFSSGFHVLGVQAMRTDEICFTHTILCPKLSTPKSLMEYDVTECKSFTWNCRKYYMYVKCLFCLPSYVPSCKELKISTISWLPDASHYWGK